jgi:hypothetical protein
MSDISERFWKRKIPVHQIIQTPWGQGKEIGIAACLIIIHLDNGDNKFLDSKRIINIDGVCEYK